MKAMLLFAVVILMSYGFNQYQKSIASHAPVAASAAELANTEMPTLAEELTMAEELTPAEKLTD